MEKLIGIFVAVTLLLSNVVIAQQDDFADPGTLPDSAFYGFKKFFEKADLFFTFDESAKVQKHLLFAEKRIAEAKAISEKGKPEFVDDLVEEYEKNLNESNRIVRELNSTEVSEIVANATSKHLSVLDGVLEIVPEQAKEAIIMAKQASLKGQNTALSVLAKGDARRAADINKQTIKDRLAAAKQRAESGEDVEDLLEEYELALEVIDEIAQQDDSIAEELSKELNNNLLTLDEIEDLLPEEAKSKLQEKKSLAIGKQKETLTSLANQRPERAAEIYSESLDARLARVKTKAENNQSNYESEVQIVEDYSEFGNEISQIAQQIGQDPTKVEQLVTAATSRHLAVLEDVYNIVPEQAKQSILDAINSSATAREISVSSLKERGKLGDLEEETPVSDNIKDKLNETTVDSGTTNGNSVSGNPITNN